MPVRVQRSLRLALAFVLCLQASLALAHCVQNAAREGFFRTLLSERCLAAEPGAATDAGHAPVDGAPGHVALAFCPICHGLPHVALPVPELALAPPPAAGTVHYAAGEPALRPASTGPPYASTGPPLSA